ncbi:MAG: hypothetical protein MUC38_06970 [Cyclobacteriaceae bacterium]|jgi:hypothetical protein|nr:hypothetical protein [Cyclobacteriaceae bacterium]
MNTEARLFSPRDSENQPQPLLERRLDRVPFDTHAIASAYANSIFKNLPV